METATIIDIEDGLGIMLPQKFVDAMPEGLEHLECEVIGKNIYIRIPRKLKQDVESSL